MASERRNEHFVQVLEAIIQYTLAGNAATFISRREQDELHIDYTLADADEYHRLLSGIMNEDALQREFRTAS